ncbi:hypothetical protein [Nonomuraea rosea]
MGFTQAEKDVADVMIWLRCNHGREASYADIAAGVEIPDGHRLRRAVKVTRVVAANRGDRLERFLPSQSPARRRVFVTRVRPRRPSRTSGCGTDTGAAKRGRRRGRRRAVEADTRPRPGRARHDAASAGRRHREHTGGAGSWPRPDQGVRRQHHPGHPA